MTTMAMLTCELLYTKEGRASSSRVLVIRASQKSEQPSKGLIRMRGKAPELASDIGNLVKIHQGQDKRVEHGKHLSDSRHPYATIVFSQRSVTPPMKTIFHGPMVTN